MVLRLLRQTEISKRHLFGRSTLYEHIRTGVFPAPIKSSNHTSAWLEHESDAIICARIMGRTDAEIRELVRQLVADRAKLADRITA
jgi:predicted DNA-binding transcriptional regulator AlpA